MKIYYNSAVLFERLFFRNFFPVYRFIYFLYKYYCERRSISRIKEFIRPGMRVVDIGANIGFYSILFAKLVGETGEVHAFEPDFDNFARLQSCSIKYKNIICNNQAVDKASGTIILYKSPDLNVDGRTYDTGEGREACPVKAVCIDDYFANEEKIDIVKIDIQGYEYSAVQGMKKTVQRSDRVVMLGEFWPYGLAAAGTAPGDFISLLEEVGFAISFDSALTREELLARKNDQYFYVDFLAVYQRLK